MKLRAHWTGPPPQIGDYLMSAMRPRFAYRIAAVRETAVERLEITVERVSPGAVPVNAQIHPWQWDKRRKVGR